MDETSELLRHSSELILVWKGIILSASAYLMILGVSALAAPNFASKFLKGFAQGPWSNSIEAILRALVGTAFVGLSPETDYPLFISVFGAFLVSTALMMLVLPGPHKKYATIAVPFALQILPVLGGLSIGLGIALIWIFFA